MMVMFDWDAASVQASAEEYGLSFPVLGDTTRRAFDRWDPSYRTPSATIINRGMVVHTIDGMWSEELIQQLLEENGM